LVARTDAVAILAVVVIIAVIIVFVVATSTLAVLPLTRD
jgi:hypothetical protein